MKELVKLGTSIVIASAVAAAVGGAMNLYATSEEERNKQNSLQFAGMTGGAMLMNQLTDAVFNKLNEYGKEKWRMGGLFLVRFSQLLALIGLTFLGAIAGKALIKPGETSDQFVKDATAFPPVLAVAMLAHVLGQMVGESSKWKNIGVAAVSNFVMLSAGAVLFAKITGQPYLAGMNMLLPFAFAGMAALAMRMIFEKMGQNSKTGNYILINDQENSETTALLPKSINSSIFSSCLNFGPFKCEKKARSESPEPV